MLLVGVAEEEEYIALAYLTCEEYGSSRVERSGRSEQIVGDDHFGLSPRQRDGGCDLRQSEGPVRRTDLECEVRSVAGE